MYLVNKNINHNGKDYPKGSEIKSSDAGFKDLLGAGHLDEVNGSSKKAEPEAAPEVELEAPPEMDGEESSKKRKSKRG
jgi:hypothetical protein